MRVCIQRNVRSDVLVSSRRNTAEKLSDLRADEMADLFLLVQRVQKMIERHFTTDSSSVVVQDGPAAGRTVKVWGVMSVCAHTHMYSMFTCTLFHARVATMPIRTSCTMR